MTLEATIPANLVPTAAEKAMNEAHALGLVNAYLGTPALADVDRVVNELDPIADGAMSIIAQGVFGEEGGLDKNSSRISEALSLLDHSLEATPSASLPNELTSNFETMQMSLGFNQVLLAQANKNHEKFIGFLEQRISDTENIDPLKAITQLLDDSRALEASYQALARIRQLNLYDFLI